LRLLLLIGRRLLRIRRVALRKDSGRRRYEAGCQRRSKEKTIEWMHKQGTDLGITS
jgi:hypothetical protein